MAIVGGGNMGRALISGLLRRGMLPEDVRVAEISPQARASLTRDFAVSASADARAALEGAAVVVIALKPEHVAALIAPLQPLFARTRPVVISVAAGIRIASLQTWCGADVAVVRAMPNRPALVGAGVTAISGGSWATSRDLAWGEDVLTAVGTVVRLPERLLDAVTGLSGSGPAYFFLVAEALVEAGVQMGLTREVSRTLVAETMRGSAALLHETGRDPEVLRAMVTSPAGTTAAGVRTLEARAVRSAFMEAVAAATERSRNLQR